MYTVKPPNRGLHVGQRNFVHYREVSLIWRLKCTGIIRIGTSSFERCPLFRMSFIRGSTVLCAGVLGVCSEVKGLQFAAEKHGAEISPFPPGHVRTYELGMEGQVSLVSEKRVVSIGGSDLVTEKGLTLSSSVQMNVRMLLKEAVKKRLMTERRIGCLLSGGLDSSLVAGLVVECIREASNGYIHKGYP